MEGIDELLARHQAGPTGQSVPWNRQNWEVLWAEDPASTGVLGGRQVGSDA